MDRSAGLDYLDHLEGWDYSNRSVDLDCWVRLVGWGYSNRSEGLSRLVHSEDCSVSAVHLACRDSGVQGRSVHLGWD
jgi:hypothetical protein